MLNESSRDAILRELQKLEGIERQAMESLEKLFQSRKSAEEQLRAAFDKPKPEISPIAFKPLSDYQKEVEDFLAQHSAALKNLERL